MSGGEHPRPSFARRLLDQGAVDAADAHIQAVLDREPEQAGALSLAGEIALRRGHPEDAADLFERVGDAGGSGAAHYARGDFDKAVPALAKAIAALPVDQRAWRLLGEALLTLDARQPLEELARASGEQADLDAVIATGVMVSAALAGFVAGEPDVCQRWVAAAEARMAGDGSEEALRAIRRRAIRLLFADSEERREWAIVVYTRYLQSLLPRMSTDPTDATEVLHVIGDSHCLSPACLPVSLDGALHRVRPHLVVGAKAWHLAAAVNRKRGPQRTAFQLAAARIPQGARVVVCFGEIDCRADEGLFVYLDSHRDVVQREYIDRFVAAYLDNVMTQLAGHRLIIYGPPAPPAERASPPGFIDMVRAFNEALGAATRARSLPYLDAHALSSTADGTSNGRWHMDDFHLVPEAFGAMLKAAGL